MISHSSHPLTSPVLPISWRKSNMWKTPSLWHYFVVPVIYSDNLYHVRVARNDSLVSLWWLNTECKFCTCNYSVIEYRDNRWEDTIMSWNFRWNQGQENFHSIVQPYESIWLLQWYLSVWLWYPIFESPSHAHWW